VPRPANTRYCPECAKRITALRRKLWMRAKRKELKALEESSTIDHKWLDSGE